MLKFLYLLSMVWYTCCIYIQRVHSSLSEAKCNGSHYSSSLNLCVLTKQDKLSVTYCTAHYITPQRDEIHHQSTEKHQMIVFESETYDNIPST